jgi:hypothetical protein
MARRRLLLALCCAAALCAAQQPGGGAAKAPTDSADTQPAAGSGGGVTWLVQLSDLHLSAHAWPERCAIAASLREKLRTQQNDARLPPCRPAASAT